MLQRTVLVLFCIAAAAAGAQPAAVDARVDRLLSQMTLEEKLAQLTQLVEDQPEFTPAFQKGLIGSILHGGPADRINQIQRSFLSASRLNVPILFANDVIHGFRTIFPIPLAIASSWNPELAELSAHVAAREGRAAGVRWTFAPMVDIARDARWGRIAEGAGEDPVLGAAMAAAYVRGFQGTDLGSEDSLLACAKHYAAYGAAEGGRDYNAAELSERTLREVYLPPFRAAVDAGVATLMSAFETVNGVPSSANKHLLNEVLRDEWKFRGFVVSDWDAVAELMNHGIASSKKDAARKAITAGVDMDMWDNAYSTLASEVRAGRLPIATIDRAVRRVLRIKIMSGLMDQPYADEKQVVVTDDTRRVARRIAQQSIVLLKNDDGVLPLTASARTIAVIGPLADSKEDMLGPWAAQGKPEDVITALAGIRERAGDAIIVRTAPGVGLVDATTEGIASAADLARTSDVTIAILGESREMSGEAASRTSLDLPGQQQQLLEALVATGKPVVLVVMSGRPLAIAWAAAHVPAILQAWFGGTETGHALADVLFGDVNPSGKLPVTVPRTVGQVPIYYTQLPTGRPAAAADKYTSKYFDVPIGPLFPFGFGMSYTQFQYADMKVSAPRMQRGGAITVSASIRNTGTRSGEEIVQMYIGDPVASVSRPRRELKAFQRIRLEAGESKRVSFRISERDLQFWQNGSWIAEAGAFNVWIAPSSDAGVMAGFELAGP